MQSSPNPDFILHMYRNLGPVALNHSRSLGFRWCRLIGLSSSLKALTHPRVSTERSSQTTHHRLPASHSPSQDIFPRLLPLDDLTVEASPFDVLDSISPIFASSAILTKFVLVFQFQAREAGKPTRLPIVLERVSMVNISSSLLTVNALLWVVAPYEVVDTMQAYSHAEIEVAVHLHPQLCR